MEQYIWLAVTNDELELPIAVADTSTELGRMVGCDRGNVARGAMNSARGKFNSRKGRRFYRIPREEDDE